MIGHGGLHIEESATVLELFLQPRNRFGAFSMAIPSAVEIEKWGGDATKLVEGESSFESEGMGGSEELVSKPYGFSSRR